MTYMTAATGETIPQLIETARTLKRARRMQQEFMLLWALDRAKRTRHGHGEMDSKPGDELADPKNRDWRMLYRGSVLDD